MSDLIDPGPELQAHALFVADSFPGGAEIFYRADGNEAIVIVDAKYFIAVQPDGSTTSLDATEAECEWETGWEG